MGAIVTGIIAGIFLELAHVLELLAGIDDPIDAFAVHGACGIVGVVTAPLFAREGCELDVWAANLLGMAAIMGWSGLLTMAPLLPMKLLGKLTVSDEEQDSSKENFPSPLSSTVLITSSN